MKIGISGASGQLGYSTVEHLKTRVSADQIVGISRTPDKLAGLGIESRAGDLDKPELLVKAYEGLDRLLIIPGHSLEPGVRGVQAAAAVEAAVKADVAHVVYFSVLGARAVASPHLWEGFFAGEQALMRKAKSWTILRMAFYMESMLDEAQMAFPRGVLASISNTPVNFVARDDLGAAAAGLLTSTGHHGVIYQATGEATFNAEERAALLSKAAGKPLASVQITTEQLEEGLQAANLSPGVINAVRSVQNMWAVGGFDVTTGDIERLSGRKPRAFADFAAQAFK
jgi:NAD(P)H dehydrogenase (quinone)